MWKKRVLLALKISGAMILLAVIGLAVLPYTPFSQNLQSLVVLSGSMEPTVKTGSLILSAAVKTESLKEGDIITFAQADDEEIPITHRIESINEDGSFTTKGDANDKIDNKTVSPEKVQGKMFLAIPWLGFLINFAKSKEGLLFLIILPASLVAINEFQTLKEELKKIYKDKKRINNATSKITNISIAILLIATISSNGTFAFLSDSEKASQNQITIGLWGEENLEERDFISLLEIADPNTEDFIVLNEFLPNPLGLETDGNPRPDGEWVELYNKNTTTSFDLKDWYLYDNHDTQDLAITTVNSSSFDKDGILVDGNTTIIPAQGFLVVYLNGQYSGWLNNADGDSVRLYNGVIGQLSTMLIDSHTYTGSVPDNKTIARIPDGTGSWVDPIPTPGSTNKLELLDYTEKLEQEMPTNLLATEPSEEFVELTEQETSNVEPEVVNDVEESTTNDTEEQEVGDIIENAETHIVVEQEVEDTIPVEEETPIEENFEEEQNPVSDQEPEVTEEISSDTIEEITNPN